jgi:hypothetical protein
LLLRRPERDRFFRWAHPTKRPCTLARARCARKEWSRGVSEPGKARQPPQLRRFRQTESPHCKSECNLRGKRSDPSRGANVRSKAGAVPVVTVPTREIRNCRRVRTTSGEMFPAGNVRTRRKDLTRKIQIGNGLNGPAMRPKHPHAAESGVGKHTARESEAPNSMRGKERVANAHPQIWPRDRMVPGPYCFQMIDGRPAIVVFP